MDVKFNPVFSLEVDFGDEGKETLCEARFERTDDSMPPKLVVARDGGMADITRMIAAMVSSQMSAALKADGNRNGMVSLADYRPEHSEVA